MATRRLFEQDGYLDDNPSSSGSGYEDYRLAYGKSGTPTRNMSWGTFLAWLAATFLPTYFLKKSLNLSDTNATAARYNLYVYSKAETDSIASSTSVSDRNWATANFETLANAALLQPIINVQHQYHDVGGVSEAYATEIDHTLGNVFYLIATNAAYSWFKMKSPTVYEVGTKIKIVVPDSDVSIVIAGLNIKGMGTGKYIVLDKSVVPTTDLLGASIELYCYQQTTWMITGYCGKVTFTFT
jgi:hypothetical protein